MFVRRVLGKSMLPTLKPGQLVLAIKDKNPAESDIVIAKLDGREVVKRITAVNNGQYFLIGDNRQASTDSRHKGPVTNNAMLGRVIWPRIRR